MLETGKVDTAIATSAVPMRINPPGYIDFGSSVVNVTLSPGDDKVVNFVNTHPTASQPTPAPTAVTTKAPIGFPTASLTLLPRALISENVTDAFNNPIPG
jgi:hypothetical protein